jgi:hypothetical protein
MNNRPIVMYLGGFAKLGGIETFARDFLLAMPIRRGNSSSGAGAIPRISC